MVLIRLAYITVKALAFQVSPIEPYGLLQSRKNQYYPHKTQSALLS